VSDAGERLGRQHQQEAGEDERRRDGERERDPGEPERLLARPRDRDVHGQGGEREQRQAPCPPGDEQQRERRRHADRRDHPGRELDHEPAELRAGVAAVRVPQHALRHRLAGEREDARRARDDREREPRGVDDVLRRAPPLVEPDPGKGHARDERERGGGDGNERRADQVRVREARHVADAELGGEAEADHVQRLEHERERDAAPELEQPRARAAEAK
jgi:hypothetical protein